MSSKTQIDVDYLVIGAGAMGMAFIDTLLSSSPKATVALVDKYARPGGHWTTAYPFVRLHQPSAFYGVNSKHLGQNKIDQVGLNKGLYELASGDEVCGYYAQVIQDTFLPSGRVQYFPKSVWDGDRGFQSILTGQEFEVADRTKLVDATYMKVTVPSMRPPVYNVADGVNLVTPNDMTKLSRPFANYTVVGAGKTGIDACLWLLTMGIDPAQITWIMPRDSWLFNRAMFKDYFITRDNAAIQKQTRATMEATSTEDLFRRMEDTGHLLRLDKKIEPTMFRCATVSDLEFEELLRIKDIVRLGRIKSITAGEVVFEHGSQTIAEDTVFIDCTADGLESRPALPMFTPQKITLQPVRYCQQVFSAAFVAHVEASYDDDSIKNELCLPVPHPNDPIDLLKTSYLNNQNMLRWSLEPNTVAWLGKCRLDWSTALISLDVEDVKERDAARQKLQGQLKALSSKLQLLIGESGSKGETLARM